MAACTLNLTTYKDLTRNILRGIQVTAAQFSSAVSVEVPVDTQATALHTDLVTNAPEQGAFLNTLALRIQVRTDGAGDTQPECSPLCSTLRRFISKGLQD